MVGARRVVTARLDGGEVGSSAQFGAKGTYFWLVRRWRVPTGSIERSIIMAESAIVVIGACRYRKIGHLGYLVVQRSEEESRPS
jgi:hypothetical protein